ncbi:MAG: hypothetical protein OXE58_10500 [Acidobacteria bacterium]|nr:hypothetical protein [Acidobacteriota bacterium]
MVGPMLRLVMLAALVGPIPAAATTGAEERERRLSGVQPAEETQRPRPQEEGPAWEIQVAGHGGAAGLVSRGEVRLALASTLGPADETVGYSRERSWGAGLRLMRDRWGVEARHHRVAGRGFTPSAMMRETHLLGSQDLAITESADDLLSAFAVREFPLVDGKARLYLAVGGGYLLMGGDSGRLVLEDLPPGVSRSGSFDGVIRDGTVEMTGGDFLADRGTPVFGGSLGLTVKMGQLIVRPRFDVYFGGARSTEESWDMQFDFAEVEHRTEATMTLNTTMRPRFFLFSVDVGWSSRP